MCRIISCVVGRGCLLWPMHSLGKTLLAFTLLHFVLQSQTSLLLQVSLDFLLLHSSPLWWKGHLFFGVSSRRSCRSCTIITTVYIRNIFKFSSPWKEAWYPLSVTCSSTANQLFVSMDSSILDISYKLNHIICSHLGLSSLNLHNVSMLWHILVFHSFLWPNNLY